MQLRRETDEALAGRWVGQGSLPQVSRIQGPVGFPVAQWSALSGPVPRRRESDSPAERRPWSSRRAPCRQRLLDQRPDLRVASRLEERRRATGSGIGPALEAGPDLVDPGLPERVVSCFRRHGHEGPQIPREEPGFGFLLACQRSGLALREAGQGNQGCCSRATIRSWSRSCGGRADRIGFRAGRRGGLAGASWIPVYRSSGLALIEHRFARSMERFEAGRPPAVRRDPRGIGTEDGIMGFSALAPELLWLCVGCA